MITSGIDLIEINRIKRAYQKFGKKFLERVFTDRETFYAFQRKEPFVHLAGRFAAKEAVMKALGTGFGKGVYFKNIEILRRKGGPPYVVLHGKIKNLLKDKDISISITHDKKYAIAFCVIINKK